MTAFFFAESGWLLQSPLTLIGLRLFTGLLPQNQRWPATIEPQGDFALSRPGSLEQMLEVVNSSDVGHFRVIGALQLEVLGTSGQLGGLGVDKVELVEELDLVATLVRDNPVASQLLAVIAITSLDNIREMVDGGVSIGGGGDRCIRGGAFNIDELTIGLARSPLNRGSVLVFHHDGVVLPVLVAASINCQPSHIVSEVVVALLVNHLVMRSDGDGSIIAVVISDRDRGLQATCTWPFDCQGSWSWTASDPCNHHPLAAHRISPGDHHCGCQLQ
jgi:hypothetical protein